MGAQTIAFQTAASLADQLAAGDLTAVELLDACLARTAQADPTLHAFNSYDADAARALAKASDERRQQGSSRGPLDGLPVTLKDNIAVMGQPLTCSSRILEHFVSPYSAHVVEQLEQQGVVYWGRLNLDEFAMGSSTENSAFGVTANPWDLERVPGGSSGGCAASVAAGLCPLSLGSDTGGSIRQPAAFCGIVGLKPTYGLVSRYGLVAFASSLDQIGPFARTVEDAALLLQAVAGHDTRDTTSFPVEIPDYRAALREPKPCRIGIPKEYFGEGLNPEVRAAVEQAQQWYSQNGYTIKEVSLPRTDLAIPVYYILAPAEASSNLARFDGIRYGYRSPNSTNAVDIFTHSRTEGFGDEVKRRILLGTYALSSGYYDAYYKKAQQVRTLIREDFMEAFKEVDVLLTPTTPEVAFPRGAKADPLAMYLNDIYTINANLAGLPALSLPCGFNTEGMPIGLQLIGQPFAEADLLPVAHHFEQAHDFWQRRPDAV